MKKLFFYTGILSLLLAAGCTSNGNEPDPKPNPGITKDTTRHITPVIPVELK